MLVYQRVYWLQAAKSFIPCHTSEGSPCALEDVSVPPWTRCVPCCSDCAPETFAKECFPGGALGAANQIVIDDHSGFDRTCRTWVENPLSEWFLWPIRWPFWRACRRSALAGALCWRGFCGSGSARYREKGSREKKCFPMSPCTLWIPLVFEHSYGSHELCSMICLLKRWCSNRCSHVTVPKGIKGP